MGVTLDSRGVASVFCEECGAFVKKASTVDVVSIYEEKLSEKGDLTPSGGIDKLKCRWCTERYYTRVGRLGTIYSPVAAKYCPVCGRELKESDRNY